MRALLVASLLLLALVPAPASAASGNVATDMLVDVVDADHVLLRETLTEHDQHFSPWTLHVPENATVVEAHDANGFLGNVTNADGTVTIKTPARNVPLPYSFTVTFAKKPDAYGDLRAVFAPVGSAGGASTTRIRLPANWLLVGAEAQPASIRPDAQGVFTAQEAFGATFAYAPPGSNDTGPDARVSGEGVFREGVAHLTATGGTLSLTLTYDTSVYGSVGTIVPQGATLVSARTSFGDVPTSGDAGQVRLDHPYPFAAGLGARPVTLEFRLPAPTPFGGAFLNATLNMPAGERDTATLVVSLADGLTHVATRTRAATDATGLKMRSDKPFVADVAFLPPASAGQADFDAGIYHVRVDQSLADKARLVASNATALLARTSAFARGDAVTRPFFLTYSADASLFTLFSGEEGFYSTGLNTITVQAKDLDNVTATQADFTAVSTLVHETTHGLVDRLVPRGYGNLSFFQEGLARLAENHLEALFPSEVVDCHTTATGTSCVRTSVRPDAGDVQARYRAGRVFPVTWNAENAGGEIGILYDTSGMIFRAYEERSAPDALGKALIALSARGAGASDESDAQAVVAALLQQSPGLTQASLLYPGATISNAAAGTFAACMGDLVAPPYPPPVGKPLPDRPSECGDAPPKSAAGERSFSVDAGPVPDDTSSFTLPPPPTSCAPSCSAPVAVPTSSSSGLVEPVPVPTRSGTGADGASGSDADGATARTSPVPFPSWPLVAAALVAVALLARRRA